MKVLDLFCGAAGGWSLGLHRAGFETVAACEIDAWRREIFSANFPQVKMYEDIRDLDAKRLRRDLGYLPDFICGSPPCFSGDTLIETSDGRRPIEALVPGDLVWTHERRLRSIIQIMRRQVFSTVTVKCMGAPSIVTTAEHPFYVRRKSLVWNSARRTSERCWSAPEWVAAGELTRDCFVGYLIDDVSDEPSPASELARWYLIGRWLGDGWLRTGPYSSNVPQGQRGSVVTARRHDILICCGIDEADDLAEDIAAAGYHAVRTSERTTARFTISKKELFEFLAVFGHGAANKSVPGFVHELPRDVQAALFEGWSHADGWVTKQDIISVTTVSRALAIGMARIARTAFRRPVSVHFAEVPATTIIEGRMVNQLPQYAVRVAPRHREAFVEGHYAWCPVRSVAVCNEQIKVFNIGVEGDESYVANGVIVHNCQDASSANPKGKGTAGARTGLFFEALRVIEAVRPLGVALENVPALRTRGLDWVLDELEGAGYACWPVVVGAWHTGAPHKRNRLWLLAADAEGLKRDERRRSDFAFAEPAACGEPAGLAECEGLAQREGVGGDACEELAALERAVGAEGFEWNGGPVGGFRMVARLRAGLVAQSGNGDEDCPTQGNKKSQSRASAATLQWSEKGTTEHLKVLTAFKEDVSAACLVQTHDRTLREVDTPNEYRLSEPINASYAGERGRGSPSITAMGTGRTTIRPISRPSAPPVMAASTCMPDTRASEQQAEREFNRVARQCISAYGDAVMPQITEAIGRAFLKMCDAH